MVRISERCVVKEGNKLCVAQKVIESLTDIPHCRVSIFIHC